MAAWNESAPMQMHCSPRGTVLLPPSERDAGVTARVIPRPPTVTITRIETIAMMIHFEPTTVVIFGAVLTAWEV
jgi:hypothetical protein